ncbi:hypothetical protein F4860DRAFT_281054 [Xylaria cubensis]|nr:hypothetical protein F4860DRAFT_281054 [Xylaria cubensis]
MEDASDPEFPAQLRGELILSLHKHVIVAHRQLASMYQIHGPRLKELWHSMEQAQREKAMNSLKLPGAIPKHSEDPSMEEIYTLTPEWNLRDITSSASDLILHILEHRATELLCYQYFYGHNDGLGDYNFIIEQIRAQKLQIGLEFVPDFYRFFLDDDAYGKPVRIPKNKIARWKLDMDSRLCIPEFLGRLVLTRQLNLIGWSTGMFGNILSHSAATALSKLSVKPSIPGLDIRGVSESALEQKFSLADGLLLICRHPFVLAYHLDNWFSSRPELVADEKGRKLPANNQKLIGCAFLDMMHSTVRGIAVWHYICQLLELLGTSADKSHRQILLQEISNVCHLEYNRLKAILKRQMSTRTGASWFKRISNSYENGNARIVLKGNPEIRARGNQQHQYLLRLCQTKVTALTALNWLVKLGELHSNDPSLRDKLHDEEINALDSLTFVATFIQSLSQATPLPHINRKVGQRFITGAAELEIELNQVKSQIDLSDFAFPRSKLLKPDIAEAALAALNDSIIDKTGTTIRLLYQNLTDDCIASVHEQLNVHPEAAKNATIESQYIPFPPESPKTHEVCVQERRQKEKTRPAHSSVYEILSTDQETVASTVAPPSPPKPFKVKPATAELFSTLFGRAESRGSISWANFEAAMAELKFSVVPKFGSVYTFSPPETMTIQKPLTLHRPHKSHIEGYVLLVFARRLNRLYGWGESTFQAA